MLNTLFGYSAVTADVNISYANLLRLLNATIPNGVKRGDDYRLEARNIASAIPINIIVNNDREGRIQSAFAKVFSSFGFKSTGSGARYVLRVNVAVSQVNVPGDTNKYALMELSAALTDTVAKETLLPYSFTNRDGHATTAGAENRVFLSAESMIEEEYKEVLSGYLSRLLPER